MSAVQQEKGLKQDDSCHVDHLAARGLASSLRQEGDRFGLAPQALAEFVHIVTDAKRFTAPLNMAQAMERAQVWWNAAEVERVWPDESAVSWFLAAMTLLAVYRDGRRN